MKIVNTHDFKKALLASLLLLFVHVNIHAQNKEVVYKHKRLGKGKYRYNCLIHASDSVKIPEGLLNRNFAARTISYQGHSYTFKYNKTTKQDELFKDDTTNLGYATGYLQNLAYQFTTKSGMNMTINRDSKTNSWSVVSGSTTLVQGFYTKEYEVKKFRIVEVDSSVEGTDIALLVSFAYSAQFIQDKVNAPGQTGTIIVVVLLGALMSAAQ